MVKYGRDTGAGNVWIKGDILMDRIFFRTGNTGDNRENKGQRNVAVVGLGHGVGTTVVASSLAFYFAEKGNSVTFVQCGRPESCNGLLYDAVAMDRRFSGRVFEDTYGILACGGGIRRLRNPEAGISWLLITPEDVKKGIVLDAEQRAGLVYGPRDDVCVFDMDGEDGWLSFAADMDDIVAVVDPLPSRMAAAAERFRELRSLENSGTIRFHWLVNGMNSGVSRRQVRGYLKSSNLLWIDRVPAEVIYSNEFRCRFHWESEVIRGIFDDTFTKVSQ